MYLTDKTSRMIQDRQMENQNKDGEGDEIGGGSSKNSP